MDEPAAPHQIRARAEPPAEQVGMDGVDGVDGAHPSRQAIGQVMSRTPTSGAKGFAVILGAMLGIIGLLWLIATLASPH
jgi:hypothetical protein